MMASLASSELCSSGRDTQASDVVMLVTNPCTHDSRVIKEAESLVASGYRVRVLCTAAPGVPALDVRNGVTYERHDPRQRHARGQPSRRPLRKRKLVKIMMAIRVKVLPGRLKKDWARGASALLSLGCRLPLKAVKSRLLGFMPRSYRDFTRYRRLYFRRLIELKPAVIHAHDLPTLPVATEAAAVVEAKLVYDAHELEMHRNARYSRIARWMRRRAETHGIRAADTVITVCDSIADYLCDDYRIRRPIVVLNAPLLGNGNDADGKTLRADVPVRDDQLLVIYVGAVTINRGLDVCVRMLPHVPDAHLAMVGPRHLPTEQKVRQIADELAVSDRVHFLDPVPSHLVTSYIRSADISLVPIQNACLSYYFCFPNKILESVVAGIPVVASDFPELRRFVERTGAGLVMNETDPEDVARAILQIWRNMDRYRPTERTAELINMEYGWATQAARLEEAYALLCPRRA